MNSTIKTFEDACKFLGINPEECNPAVTGIPERHQAATLAHAKLSIVAEALNKEANGGQEWQPDWTNGEWDKWYPWFNMSSGSGLSYCDFGNRTSYSNVGSRLCYISADVAEYAGTQFADLYTELFIIKKES